MASKFTESACHCGWIGEARESMCVLPESGEDSEGSLSRIEVLTMKRPSLQMAFLVFRNRRLKRFNPFHSALPFIFAAKCVDFCRIVEMRCPPLIN
jgi:hypothetical protein